MSEKNLNDTDKEIEAIKLCVETLLPFSDKEKFNILKELFCDLFIK